MKLYKLSKQQIELIEKVNEISDRMQNDNTNLGELDDLKEAMNKLSASMIQFDGLLVRNKETGKLLRVFHSHYAKFKAYGSRRDHFKWSNNMWYIKLDLDKYDILDYDNEQDWYGDWYEVEKDIKEYKKHISFLQNKIRELNNKQEDILPEDYVPCVNPEDFYETDEVDNTVWGGDTVYISEGFCEYTNIRVTS